MSCREYGKAYKGDINALGIHFNGYPFLTFIDLISILFTSFPRGFECALKKVAMECFSKKLNSF
ncbi:MAG: hypothetical protein ACTSRI_12550 [Promethearchaeota archaeon]